ncbi:unnamed protein product [Penicillium roqueforti FM164]|uniref:Genomic scaffold, ProqFM164S03 n=1 Tax=Penicillium roqueforti (strain FM164) TaxID=1365484 RepID=W6QV12_PENRF|nr:unnamed protein product [Penicillium roqueforti FM164]
MSTADCLSSHLECSCCDPGATLAEKQRAPLQEILLAAPRPSLVLAESRDRGDCGRRAETGPFLRHIAWDAIDGCHAA